MQIINKIVKTQNGPLSGNVLWLDSKEKKLKFLSEDGWKALNDEAADVTEMKETVSSLEQAIVESKGAITTLQEDASNLHPIVINPNSTDLSKQTTVTFPYSNLYYKEISYESDYFDKRNLQLGVTVNNGVNYLQALYYTSGSNSAQLYLRPQYYNKEVIDSDAYITIGEKYDDTTEYSIYLHTSKNGVWVDDLVSAMNKTNTLLSASTTIEKLPDGASLSDVVAKCNEVITALGSLNLIAASEAATE